MIKRTIRRSSLLLVLSLLTACTLNGIKSTPTEHYASDPKAAEINTRLGLNYMQRGDYKVAMDKLQKALQQDPNLPSAHNTIAILYQRLKENDKAEYHFKQSVERAPDYSEAQNNYGVFLCQQERYTEAEQHFLAAMKNPLYTNVDQALENAGICVGLIPDATAAESYFRKALQINPNLSKSLFQMARLSYLNIDYAQSKLYLDRYQSVSQWSAEALLLAIQLANKSGDQDAVSSYSLILRARFPDSDEAQRVKKGQY